MLKTILIALLIIVIFYWLKRKHQLRNTQLETPSINNGVKNKFHSRKNYM